MSEEKLVVELSLIDMGLALHEAYRVNSVAGQIECLNRHDKARKDVMVAFDAANARAEKAETEISSLLAVIDKAVDCYFNDKGNIKDAMYALRGKVEPK